MFHHSLSILVNLSASRTGSRSLDSQGIQAVLAWLEAGVGTKLTTLRPVGTNDKTRRNCRQLAEGSSFSQYAHIQRSINFT